MYIWWRSQPLDNGEYSLLLKTLDAHLHSAMRQNASSVTVAQAADSSGDMVQAFVAGLMTLGERHGPIEQTVRFLSLEKPEEEVRRILKRGGKVPGWGGTFQKNEPDPVWNDVAAFLKQYRSDLYDKLGKVTGELHEHGKKIYPNPSAYTAAVAIALMIDAKFAVYLLIAGRLDAWAKIAAEYIYKKKSPNGGGT